MIFELSRLKSLRKQLGLTQFQLAKLAGVSQSLLAKVESGRVDPSYSSVKKIEAALVQLSSKSEPDARSIMIKSIISVQSDALVKNIVLLLRKHAISQVPVLEKGAVIGLVTEASLLSKDSLDGLTAMDVMTSPPPIVPIETKRSVLASLSQQYPFILIGKNNELAGIVTRADLIKALV